MSLRLKIVLLLSVLAASATAIRMKPVQSILIPLAI